VNVEDIFLLLVFLYSLTGQECFDSPMEEEQMKVRLYEKNQRFLPSVRVRAQKHEFRKLPSAAKLGA